MQLRRFVGRLLAVAFVLLGLMVMHGLPVETSHGVVEDAHPLVSAPGDTVMLAPSDLTSDHTAHGFCVSACVLAIGIAGVAFSLRGARHHSPFASPVADFSSSSVERCRRGHPPPRRLSLLAISLR